MFSGSHLKADAVHALALQLQLIEGSESMGDHDSGSDGGAQHARAADHRFRFRVDNRHVTPGP